MKTRTSYHSRLSFIFFIFAFFIVPTDSNGKTPASELTTLTSTTHSGKEEGAQADGGRSSTLTTPNSEIAANGETRSLGAPDLDSLIKLALERNPDLIAAREEWVASKKRVWIDTGLPDPIAGYDFMGGMRETRVGPEKYRFSVSQEIPFPLKLYEKGRMASDEAAAAAARYRATEREIIHRLSNLYYNLCFTDASLEVVEEIKEIFKRIERIAANRYASLGGGQRDVVKAQIEVAMSMEKLFTLDQARESLAALINALLDRPPLTPIERVKLPRKPELHASLEELIDLAETHRQEIAEMEALVSKGKHASHLAKLAYIPDANVGFEYTWVGSGTTTDMDDGKDSWMFPLRISIPLWQNRIIPEIQEAKRNLLASQARLSRARNQTFFEVREAHAKFIAATKMATLYETSVIPQARIALSSDQAGYEGGKSDFINLLDSQRIYLNAKLSHIQFETETLKSYADLVRATGLDLGAPK